MSEVYMKPMGDPKASQAVLNINDFPPELQKVLAAYDDEGNGILEMDEISDVFSSYKRIKEDRESGVLHLSNLPTPKFRELAAVFDSNDNGTIEPTEFQRAVEMYQSSQNRVKNLKKIVMGVVVMMVLLLCALLGVVFVAVELSKEAKVESDGAMRATGSDQVIKVNSAESFVDDTGKTRTSSGAEMTATLAATTVALKYTTPIEVLNRLQTISVAEPTFSAIGQVVGVYKVAQKMVVGTEYFKVIMTKDRRTYVLPEDEDLLTSSSQFFASDETARKLLGASLSPGRKLLEATNEVKGQVADQVNNEGDGGYFPKILSDRWMTSRYDITETVASMEECFSKIAPLIGTECAKPDPDPQAPEDHTNVFGYRRRGGGEAFDHCYCLSFGQKYFLDRNALGAIVGKPGYGIYAYDPDTLEGLDTASRDEFKQTYADKGVTDYTPVPESRHIELVAVGEFCNHVKLLEGPRIWPSPGAGLTLYTTRGEDPDTFPGWFAHLDKNSNKITEEWIKLNKVQMSVDECMQLALDTPECLPHGPTIQFHDYDSSEFVSKMNAKYMNTNVNHLFMDPSTRCSCSYACIADALEGSPAAAYGDCKGSTVAYSSARQKHTFPTLENVRYGTDTSNKREYMWGYSKNPTSSVLDKAGIIVEKKVSQYQPSVPALIGTDCRTAETRLGYTEEEEMFQKSTAYKFFGKNTNIYTWTGPILGKCQPFTVSPSSNGIVSPFGPDVMRSDYHCPKELSKDNLGIKTEGQEENDDKFHIIVDSSSADERTIKVVRSSGTGAWDYDLVFHCCALGSGHLSSTSKKDLEQEVDVILPPNPTAESKYFTLPRGREYICPQHVVQAHARNYASCTKEYCKTLHWIGGYEKSNGAGDVGRPAIVVVPISDNVFEVNRVGDACDGPGWDWDLHFTCLDVGPSQDPLPVARSSSPTCKCTTPGQGTVGRNQYTCSDTGTVGNCADHEECFATELFKEGLEASACRPKATCRCETPQQGTAGRNKIVCDGMGDTYCFADQECYRHDTFMFGDFSQTACRRPGEPAKSAEELGGLEEDPSQPTCRSFFATESGTERILPQGYYCPSIVQSTNWFDAPEDPTATFTTTNEGYTADGEIRWRVQREDIGMNSVRTWKVDKPWPEEFKLGFWCCKEKIVMNFGTSTQQDTKPVIGSMNFVVHPEDKDLPHPYPTDRYECPVVVNRDTSERKVFDNFDLFYLTEKSPWNTIVYSDTSEHSGHVSQLRKEYNVQKIQQDGVIMLADQYWDFNLQVECLDKMSSLLTGTSRKCIDVNIGRKPTGTKHTYDNYAHIYYPELQQLAPSQPKYLCEPQISKVNWLGDEDYADTFSIVHAGNKLKNTYLLETYHHAKCGADNWANIDLTIQCCTPYPDPDPMLITGNGTCPNQCLRSKSGVGVTEGGTEAPGGVCGDFSYGGYCGVNTLFQTRGSDCRECQVCEEVDVGAYPLEEVPDYTPECSQEGMLGWSYSHDGIWAGYKYYGAAKFDECLQVCDGDPDCKGFSIYRPDAGDTIGSCYLYTNLGATEIQEHGLQKAYAKCLKGRVPKLITIPEGLVCPSVVESVSIGQSFNISHEHIEDEDGNLIQKVPNTIIVNNAGDDIEKFHWNSGFSMKCCKVKSTQKLPKQVSTNYDTRRACPTEVIASVANNAPPLCSQMGAVSITYYGEPCGDRKIIWNKMIAYAANGNPVDMNACAWSAAGKDKGWRDAYTGSCGVAPAVNGISGLPTSCTEL